MSGDIERQGPVHTAPIKWAQRSDCLYLTVDLHGVSNESVEFTESGMRFRGTSEGKYFESSVEFYRHIVPSESRWKTHPLGVEIYVKKRDKKKEEEGEGASGEDGGGGGFWPHLLKDKALEKLNTVSVDWNHYVDSDEEDEKQTGFDWSRW